MHKYCFLTTDSWVASALQIFNSIVLECQQKLVLNAHNKMKMRHSQWAVGDSTIFNLCTGRLIAISSLVAHTGTSLPIVICIRCVNSLG